MSQTQHPNERQGAYGEQWIADRDDLDHRPNEADWYDCVNPRTGTKHEAKTTDEADPSGGRFRVWEDQHRSLAAANAAGVAWYDFLLLNDGEVVAHRRMKPSTVTKLVHANDGKWNRAGHHDRDGRQHKIPVEEVFPDHG